MFLNRPDTLPCTSGSTRILSPVFAAYSDANSTTSFPFTVSETPESDTANSDSPRSRTRRICSTRPSLTTSRLCAAQTAESPSSSPTLSRCSVTGTSAPSSTTIGVSYASERLRATSESVASTKSSETVPVRAGTSPDGAHQPPRDIFEQSSGIKKSSANSTNGNRNTGAS